MLRTLIAGCLVGIASFAPCTAGAFVGAAGPLQQSTAPSWQSRSYRQESAVKWRDSLRRLEHQVPTLSPSEERWLKIEIDDEISRAGNRYTKRAIAAMDSKEYEIRIAKHRLTNIVGVLESLSASPLELREEVRLWAELASQFADKELWQELTASFVENSWTAR